MKRRLFRGILKQEGQGTDFASLEAEWRQWHREQSGLLRCHWFCYGTQLYIYTEQETDDTPVCPPQWAERWLQAWPDIAGERYLVPMMDVFHDGDDDWRQHVEVDEQAQPQPQGSLARLRPSHYASYVFYHYQMQEERRYSFNASYMIGASENWIFSYSEQPCGVRRPAPAGQLTTHLTPEDWHDVMLPHFDPWPSEPGEAADLWIKMERVYSYIRA